MHNVQGCVFHDADRCEYVWPIGFGNGAEPENIGQHAVIQASRAGNAAAPLRIEGDEHVEGGPVLRPDAQGFGCEVLFAEPECG